MGPVESREIGMLNSGPDSATDTDKIKGSGYLSSLEQ